MTKNQYAEQRRDPRWQKKRLEIMQRDRFCCVECFDEKSTLNVHHFYYVTGREPWDYPNWSLQTMCENCHEAKHGGRLPDEDSAQSEWEVALNILLHGAPDVCGFLFALAETAYDSDLSLYGVIETLKAIAEQRKKDACE